MFKTVNGLKIFYKYFEGGGNCVVLLHGWGCSHASFEGAFRALEKAGRSVLSIDFPCFGRSETAPPSFGIADFSETVDLLLKELGLKKVILVGHSFGGRVCLILGKEDYVEKILLTGCAGLKPRFSLKRFLKIRLYKIKKRFVANPKGGSKDYNALDQNVKPIFVRVVNQDLKPYLKGILKPTLLVWGKSDQDTPPYMAKRLKKGILGSEIVWLDGGHFAYAENYALFNSVLLAFIKE